MVVMVDLVHISLGTSAVHAYHPSFDLLLVLAILVCTAQKDTCHPNVGSYEYSSLFSNVDIEAKHGSVDTFSNYTRICMNYV